ncbi:MAG: hypothetical protein AAGD96_19685 [Chloroflexota bacterium]
MNQDAQYFRRMIAVLRITLGVILLVTWYDNFTKGVYTADGINGLFNYIFNDTGGGSAAYRAVINGTILQTPGIFAAFQLVAELLLGLGLFFGGLTTLAGWGSFVFFLNLFLAYQGGSEWIWTYVLLTAAAFVVATTKSGRVWGLDQILYNTQGAPKSQWLW